MPAQTVVFHLQGEHDQQAHAGGRRGPDIRDEDMIRDAFEAFDVPVGDGTISFGVDDIDTHREGVTDVSGRIYADVYGTGEQQRVGAFARSLYEDGEVYNDTLKIDKSFQGRGIGSAFLDYSERQLANAGFDTVNVDAILVGRYAWAARGYKVAEFDASYVMDDWISLARVQASEFGIPVERVDAIGAAWRADPSSVYGSDIIALDPDKNWSAVFLEAPAWTGQRSIAQLRDEELAVEVFHLDGQHDQQTHGNRGGASALEASDIPVYSDEYGELMIESTGVERIRQIAYDYDGGSDVFDVVIVEQDDGSIAVDVENLYGTDGTVEGEQALEQYLNDNDIYDIRWDGERGTLHASYRAAVMAGDATPAQKLLVQVDDVYSGGFEANGETYVIGETRTYMREDNGSVEIRGSIMAGDVTGQEVGQFSRAVYEDGTVYNHSLNIDPRFQGQGIGTEFLEYTEGALQPKVVKLAAVNVGKYAWAARGYQLDTGNSSLAASTRDRWAESAREIIGRTVDPVVANRAEAVLRSWSDDLNSVYPADLLAVDDRFRDVFLEGPSWDGVRRLDDTLAASAGVEVFHLQGEHDQKAHAGGSARGVEIDGYTRASVDGYDVYVEQRDPSDWRKDPARPYRGLESVWVDDAQATLWRRSPAGLDGPEEDARGIVQVEHDGTPDGITAAVRSAFEAPERAERFATETFHVQHNQQDHAGGRRRKPIPPPPRRRPQRPQIGGPLPDVEFDEVKVAYRPRHPDGKADPGEIVWAQIPFEEDPSRSKDRPVLVIGTAPDEDTLVAVQLTSKNRRGRLPIGSGDWDRSDRPSFLKTDRFVQIDEANYRREGAYMKKPQFQDIVDVLTAQQGVRDIDLALEVFHLQGEHDQQSHAGGRGRDLELDGLDGFESVHDLDGEFTDASPERVAERFDLYGGDQEYLAESGGRIYRAPDGAYVILDEDDGTWVTVEPDLYSVDIDTAQLEIDVEESWREDVVRGPVYHGTRDDESMQSIMSTGLETRNETRGINNRWVGSSVFTSTDSELARAYGNVVEVDLPRAIADGVIDPDSLSREPGYNQADAENMVAYGFDDYSYDPYSQFIGTGEDPQTVIIGADIPPEYITPLDDYQQFATEVFHLQGQHDQQTHAGGRAAAGQYRGTAAAKTQEIAERARQGLDPSEFDGPLVSRGIAITVDDDLKRRLDTQIGRGADPSAPEEFNQHLELGPEIAEQLLDFEGHQGGAVERTAGFGQSWTTNPEVAESVHPGSGQNLVVKVVARPRQSDVLYQEIEDADGRHAGWVDADGNPIERGGRGADMIPGEMEVRIDGRSPVDIVDIQVRQGSRWESIWGDERGFGAGADELYRQFPHVKDWDLAVEVFHLQGQHDQQSHAGGRGSGKAGIQLDPDASWTAPFHERIIIDGKTHRDVPMETWRAMVKHQGAIDAASTLSIREQDAIVTELESRGLKNAIGARDSSFLGYGEALLDGVDPETSMKVPLPLTLQLSHLHAAATAGVTESSVFEDARFAELADAIQDSGASWESTQDMSIYIEETWGVTPVTGVFHAFNKGWQESSRSGPSIAVQNAVVDRFNVDPAGFNAFIDRTGGGRFGEYIGNRLPRSVRGYVDGTYNRTQAFLAETRAQEVGLYRGIRGDTYKPTAGVEITGNPISSWSQSEPVAWQFARGSSSGTGRVLTDYAPRSDVFSIAAVTGMGAVHEHEVILLGMPQTLDEVEEIS